jgi:sugar O-acyltransferase (sialic acid O-acetyltransferase NeuD family)
MKPNILLIGGGGHCKSVIDVIEQENKFTIAGIIDKKELVGQKVLGYEIIASDDDLPNLFENYKNAIVTVGQIKSNTLRVKLFNTIKDIGYNLPIIISPFAYISKHSFIDEGTIIMHNTLVNADVKIGKNCIINSKALIEHDSIIEDNCHISTGVIINGGVVIKNNTFIGSGTITKEYITIKENSFIKAGSLII